MASTNKTANYELSQFLGTDKPAWLTDYNSDMSKIDAGINTAQTTATGADGKADSANTAIGTLANLTTDVKTNLVSAINEVDSHADTAQGTANTAITNAGNVSTALDNFKALFNLRNTLSYAYNEISISGGTASNYNLSLYIARDDSGDIFKCYGQMAFVSNVSAGQVVTITLSNTGIYTDTEYNIICPGFIHCPTQGSAIDDCSITVKNNSIEIKCKTVITNQTHFLRLFPCLYFNTDFGDITE